MFKPKAWMLRLPPLLACQTCWVGSACWITSSPCLGLLSGLWASNLPSLMHYPYSCWSDRFSGFKQLPIAHRIEFKLLRLAHKTFHELTLLVHLCVIPTSTRPAPSHPGSKRFVLCSGKGRWEALGCPYITCWLTSFVPTTPRPPARELSNAAPCGLQLLSYQTPLPSIPLHPSPSCESRCSGLCKMFLL